MLPDSFDPNFRFFRKENEHLVRGIVIVGHQNNQVRSRRALFTGLVTKLGFELVDRLGASVMAIFLEETNLPSAVIIIF